MSHPFKHLKTILKHRHYVIKNAFHMGIGFHALKHDLSKFGYTEFHTSAKYYTGTCSPIYLERMNNNYYSSVCQHHTRRNPHHWEYWTDFLIGRVIAKTMPYKYATEYVCDVLSASYVYDPKGCKMDTGYKYFVSKSDHYYMTQATREYITWCLKTYSESGFKNLKKKQTKAKYKEIIKKYPDVEIFETLNTQGNLPDIKAFAENKIKK